jgi:hypothetical protein
MKMEDHFKETLRRAAANEPPVLDAWDRFERRLGRSRRWMLMASLAGVTAIVVAAVLVVPQLGKSAKGRGVTTQPSSPTPTPSPTVDPYAGWKTFENAEQHYRLRYPSDWRESVFEAVYEFNPPGLPSTDGRGAEDSFGVIVNVLESSFFEEKPLASNPDIGPGERSSDTTERRDGTILYISHRFDWSASRCITLGTTCPEGDDLILLVTIQGEDTAELMGTYREMGEQIIASLEYVS